MTKKVHRVLWLLNHTTLRKFEVEQFKLIGINEFFCPKSFPYDEGNLSASVDASLDSTLSIPLDELSILNQQNWYDSPSDDAWRIANQYFDIAIIGFFPQQIAATAKNFDGAIVLRVFGLAKGFSYTQILMDELGPYFIEKLSRLGERFWFGAGYEHLKDEEDGLLKQRNCFLPVGLKGEPEPSLWSGADKRIFFVCPGIETSPYSKSIYEKFTKDFSSFDFQIGGVQPVHVKAPNILGFVDEGTHERNMREMRVMYYDSSEPHYIHYHPFEAIRVGMPLVFMAGGLLDRCGGVGLPGRCKTIKEAQKKIKRILNDDLKLIEQIRTSQMTLLAPMDVKKCETPWRKSINRILGELKIAKTTQNYKPNKVRIAVIVPLAFRGGSLRGAKLMAQAIDAGSQQAGEDVEVIFAHLSDEECYPEEEFFDLPVSIQRRSYQWRTIEKEEAIRAMAYAGINQPNVIEKQYIVPDDGVKQFMDCDLWVIISDRLDVPLLPIKPYVCMVYDYLQRYTLALPHYTNVQYIATAHKAERVFVTTQFTQQDAIQYAGLPSKKVCKLPMLAPEISNLETTPMTSVSARSIYFLWTTNLALHKNHKNAFKALQIYYEGLDGKIQCRISGVGTKGMLKSDFPHLMPIKKIVANSKPLKKNMKVVGELSNSDYKKQLQNCAFLWHAGEVDNGTFSVIEAAYCGVPALSSDYPAMREIDTQFGLNLSWMDSSNPKLMAVQLKMMEQELVLVRERVPSLKKLKEQSIDKLALNYWQAVKGCL